MTREKRFSDEVANRFRNTLIDEEQCWARLSSREMCLRSNQDIFFNRVALKVSQTLNEMILVKVHSAREILILEDM